MSRAESDTVIPVLRDRVARDLWWVGTSAGMLAADRCPAAQGFDRQGLVETCQSLDADPGPLHAAVAASRLAVPFRLGAYFEDLVAFLVARMLAARLARGVLVFSGRRTRGELDLLFAVGGQGQHWELAVKFYLYLPGLASTARESFAGPQARDRLHRKIERLCDHQLPLAQHPDAAEVVRPWQPLRSSALVRGRLFYPGDIRCEDLDLPDLNPSHERGWWCRTGAGMEQVPPAAGYVRLGRNQWLAPVDADLDRLVVDDRAAIEAWSRSPAAGIQTIAGLDPAGREVHRGFVVPEDWPGLVI